MKTEHSIPASAQERPAWIIYQLKLRGLTLSEIARQNGWSRWAVANALRLPSYPQELALAEALELPVERLFPERYRDGRRLHPVKGSRGGAASQRSKEEAA